MPETSNVVNSGMKSVLIGTVASGGFCTSWIANKKHISLDKNCIDLH